MSSNAGTLPIKGVKFRSMNHNNGVAKVPFKAPDGVRSSMPEFRRKYLEGIRKREADRIKREKVGKILLRKLAIKFGSTHKKLIKKQVSDFLTANEKITATLLVRLECDIAEAIKNSKAEAAPASCEAVPEQATTSSYETSAKPKLPPPGTEWEVLNLYQSIIHEERQQREKELNATRKLKFKELLDQQIKEAQMLKAKLEQRDKQYHEYMVDDVKKFEESEKVKAQQEKEKHHHELEVRKQQIEEQHRAREREQAEARRIEEETIRFAKEKAQLERDKQAAKKQAESDIRRQIELSNEANRQRLKLEKQKAMEEEHRLMKEYEAKLDREALERDNAFKKRLEALEKFGAKFELTGAGKAAKEEETRFERFLLSEAKKKEENELNEILRRENEKKSKEEKARIENLRMLEWRQRLESIEKQREEELAEKYKNDLAQYQTEVEGEYRKKKEKQMAYRLQLREQQIQKARHGLGTPMESREREYNMDLLTKAVDDIPNIVDKVAQRRSQTADDAGSRLRTGGNLW